MSATTVLKGITDGLISLDRRWHCLYVNEAAAALFKTTSDKMLGKIIWETFPRLVDSRFHDEFTRAARENVFARVEDYYEPLGRWYECRCYPTEAGLTVLLSDTTGNKRIEEAILESRQALEMAISGSSAGIWRMDLNPRKPGIMPDYVYLSPQLKALIGFESDEFPNSRSAWLDRILPEDRSRLEEAAEAHASGRTQTYQVDFRIRHKDGTIRWLDSRGRLYYDDLNRPIRWAGVDMDITDRKLAGEALRENEERLRQALEAGHVFTFEWHPATNEVLRSPNCASILGWTDDATHDTGQGFFERIHPEDREAFVRLVSTLSPARPAYETTYRYVRPDDGREVVLEESGRGTFDEAGTMVCLRGLTRDITERRRAEETIRRLKEQAEHAAERARWLARIPEENPNPVLRVSKDRILLYSNSAAGKLCQYWSCWIGQQVPPVVQKIVSEALAVEAVTSCEILCSDRTFSLKVTPCPAEDYVNIFAQDITERKLAESRLAYLASFPERNPNPVMEVDLAGTIRYANAAALSLFPDLQKLGLAHPWLASWDEVVRPFREGRAVTGVREQAVGGRIYQQTFYCDPDRFVRIYGLDVTERKQAEEALRETNERLCRQTEELQAANEELQVQQEELRAQAEELREREQALQASERLARDRLAEIEAIYDSAHVGLCVFDRDLRYVRINERLAEINGIPASDHLGRTARAVVPDLADAAEKLAEEIFRTGEPVLNMEFSGTTAAQPGVRRHWIEHWLPLKDGEGRIIGINVVAHEVTEQKRAQAALEEAHRTLEERVRERTAELTAALETLKAERKRFYDVLETLPAYLVLLAPDYRVPFANRFFRERFGESHGKRCFEYLFHRTEPCEICDTYKTLKTNTPQRWEWTGPDGRIYDIYDFPFTDVDGSPLIMEMGIDITERRHAEAALKEANETLEQRVEERTAALQEANEQLHAQTEELQAQHEELQAQAEELRAQTQELQEGEQRLRASEEIARQRLTEIEALYRNAPVGLCVLDADLRWVRINERMARANGFSVAEHIGKRVRDLIPRLADAVEAPLRKVLKTGEPMLDMEVTDDAVGPGMQRTWSASWLPITNADGKVVGINVVADDITQRKAVEKALRESEERYRSLFNSMNEGFGLHEMIFDDEGHPCDYRFLDVNPAFERLTGLQRQDILGRTIFEVLPGNEPLWIETFGRVVQTGEPAHFEQFSAALGRWYEVFAYRPAENQFACVFLDVSLRAQAEERARKEHREAAFANRVLRAFVECEGDELFDRALAVVQEEMASTHGVFGYIAEPGHLVCPSMSRMLNSCEVEGKCIHYPLEKWKGLWGRALREKRSFHTNEAPPVPPGHPLIHNNLAAPIVFHGEAIGLLNVANKEGGYDDEDRKTLDTITARVAPVLYAWIQRKLREDERRQAEEALRESEQRFRMLADNSPVLIWVNGLEGCEFVNRAYLEFLGVTPHDIQRFDWAQFVHPEDREAYLNAYLAAFNRQEPFMAQFRFRRADGRYCWMKSTSLPRFTEAGAFRGYVGSTFDITDVKEAEAALRESEQRLRLALEGGRMGFWDWDVETDRSCWDERLHELLGLDLRGQATLKRFVQHVDPRDVASLNERIQKSLTDGGDFQAEFRLVRQSGEMMWVALRGKVIRDASGKAVRMLGVLFDVTPQKLMENELRRLNDQLEEEVQAQTEELRDTIDRLQDEVVRRVLAEGKLRKSSQMLEGFFQHTITPLAFMDPRFNFVRVNEAYARANGRSPEFFKGKNHFSLYPHKENQAIFEQVVRTGMPYRATANPFQHPDDPQRVSYWNWQLTPLRNEHGEVQYLVLNLQDVTQQQAALRELEHRATQLQKLTLELGQAEDRERKRMAEVLHDGLQQQLAAAKFHLGLLNSRARNDAGTQEIAVQLDSLLRDAIEQSRSLSHELSPAVLYQSDLGETFEWLARQVQTKHGLMVHTEVHGRVDSQSESLKAFLFRTGQEILFNAVKHARVQEARLRLQRKGGRLWLTIADQGRGFDPKTLGRTAGFGLLSIRERVGLLGGRMKIRSAPGKGSTFLIAVPDTQASEERRQPAEVGTTAREQGARRGAPSRGLRPPVLRILLVDDHKVMREGLAALIGEQQDMEIVGQAGDGGEAVEMAKELQPDVIIMDVAMPVMSGDEATRRIKADLPQTRIIALSMFAEPGVQERMLEAGAEAYLAKTGPSEEFLAAIRGRTTES